MTLTFCYFVIQGCSKCHQSLRGENDILSVGIPRKGEEHREMGARLHQLDRAGRKTQKENLETDTGIRYVCIELFVSLGFRPRKYVTALINEAKFFPV